MKRSILFITESLSLPHDSSQLRLLIAGLSEQDLDIHVASITDTVGASTDLRHATVHPLNIGSGQQPQRQPHQAVALGQAIGRLANSLQPNVVHAWDVNARLEVAWALRNFRSIQTFETISTLNMPRSHVRRAIRNRLASHADTVFVPHACVRDHLNDADYPADRMKIIPPGVDAKLDLDRAAAKAKLTRQLGLPESVYLACTAAKLEPRFRLKDLVWATDLLTCIRDDFHLVIVGTGRQRQRLERFVNQTEASGHVHFIDSSPKNLAMADVVAGADVYWNANLNTPCASPMLHAMALGTPVISVLGDGTSELVRHQETGFAVNFGARDEFARWTKYLIEQPAAADQLSSQGRAFAIDAYPVAAMVNAHAAAMVDAHATSNESEQKRPAHPAH